MGVYSKTLIVSFTHSHMAAAWSPSTSTTERQQGLINLNPVSGSKDTRISALYRLDTPLSFSAFAAAFALKLEDSESYDVLEACVNGPPSRAPPAASAIDDFRDDLGVPSPPDPFTGTEAELREAG